MKQRYLGKAVILGLALGFATYSNIGLAANYSAGGAVTSGTNTIAIGVDSTTSASDRNSIAMGYQATATGIGGTAIGWYAKVTGGDSIAIGSSATTTSGVAVAIGSSATAGNWSNAIGHAATASGFVSTAIGNSAKASGQDSNAIGENATASSDYANAIGYKATASGYRSNAIGSAAIASNDNAVALGNYSKTTVAHTNITEQQAVLGGTTYNYAGLASDTNGTVSVGQVGKERQIQNIAAGDVSATSTDAINGSQLYATNTALVNLDALAVKYDDSNHKNITLNNTRIANVAPGDI